MNSPNTAVEWPGTLAEGDLLDALGVRPDAEAEEQFRGEIDQIREAERAAETRSATIRIH